MERARARTKRPLHVQLGCKRSRLEDDLVTAAYELAFPILHRSRPETRHRVPNLVQQGFSLGQNARKLTYCPRSGGRDCNAFAARGGGDPTGHVFLLTDSGPGRRFRVDLCEGHYYSLPEEAILVFRNCQQGRHGPLGLWTDPIERLGGYGARSGIAQPSSDYRDGSANFSGDFPKCFRRADADVPTPVARRRAQRGCRARRRGVHTGQRSRCLPSQLVSSVLANQHSSESRASRPRRITHLAQGASRLRPDFTVSVFLQDPEQLGHDGWRSRSNIAQDLDDLGLQGSIGIFCWSAGIGSDQGPDHVRNGVWSALPLGAGVPDQATDRFSLGVEIALGKLAQVVVELVHINLQEHILFC